MDLSPSRLTNFDTTMCRVAHPQLQKYGDAHAEKLRVLLMCTWICLWHAPASRQVPKSLHLVTISSIISITTATPTILSLCRMIVQGQTASTASPRTGAGASESGFQK